MTTTKFRIDCITDDECIGAIIALKYIDQDGKEWFNPDPIQIININELPDVLNEFIKQIPCLNQSETT